MGGGDDQNHYVINGNTRTKNESTAMLQAEETMDRSSSHNNEDDNTAAVLIPSGSADLAAKKRTAISTSTKGGGNTITTTGAIPGRRRLRKVKKSTKSILSARDRIIKYAALFLLVAQMVGLVLLMRYSRTHHDPKQPLYLASTAVFVMEVMKLGICFFVVFVQTVVFQQGNNGILSEFLYEIYSHTIGSPYEIFKLTLPSVLYTIQNNLLYLALTNLDAATYQVCYQLKILTTAVFSAILLRRRFSVLKWTSLLILTVGVIIVQISGSTDQHSLSTAASAGEQQDATSHNNRFVGLIAVLCAACTSGFSGVYFEKILKGSRTSLWIRNVQMGIPSVIIAYITVYMKDGTARLSQNGGFFGGYNTIVWIVVIVQAVGGLIVATVVKYADNVLKVFATSFSIIISCIISAFLFDFHPTFSFLIGASLVVTATVLYSSPERKTRRKSILPTTRK